MTNNIINVVFNMCGGYAAFEVILMGINFFVS